MKKNSLIIFMILILPYIEPLSFKEIYIVDTIYSALKILFFGIIILYYVSYIKSNGYKISKYLIILIFFQFELYLSTFFNEGDYGSLFGQTVSILATAMLLEIYIRENKIKTALKALIIILFTFSAINTIELILTPKLDIKDQTFNTFLGMDNRYIFFLLPLSIFSIIYSILQHNKLNVFTYITIILSIFQLFYVWSVSAMLSMIILLIFTIFLSKLKIFKKLDFKFYLIVIIILNILLVFFQIQYYFEDFVVNVLHKDLALSGRVYTWNLGIEKWKENMLFGIGGRTISYLQDVYYGTNAHAHNLFLNILVNGGIISLAILMLLYIEIDKKLKQCKNRQISSILSFAIFLILFLSLTDTYDIFLVFIIYEISFYSNIICNSGGSDEKQD